MIMLDVGSNISPKTIDYYNYGQMGAILAQVVLKKEKPRVAILNIGSESVKGDEVRQKASQILEDNLAERKKVFSDLVSSWEKTRLPKGLSTPEKRFFHRQDRSRHFANRRPDLTYLICDEQMRDIEGYLKSLNDYKAWYRETFLKKDL